MHLRQAVLQIDSPLGNKTYTLQPDRTNSFDELYIDFRSETGANQTRYSVFLHPKQNLTVRLLELQFEAPGPAPRHFFSNGFQSWSESRLLAPNENIPQLRRIARPFMGRYGDDHTRGISGSRDVAHSWTYTYLSAGTPDVVFLGSLNEHTGFTLFLYDRTRGILTVRKDMSGLALSHSFPALDVVILHGRESEVFDIYFSQLEQTGPGKQAIAGIPADLGWTSWYRYFNQISEKIILENADAIVASGLPFRYLQIDDGWQTAVGDWRSVKPEFPAGMGKLAAGIRQRGLTPGLWLAPFVASAGSDLVRRHPEWLLKKPDGKPLRVGWNPGWGGWFFALDFYHPGVQDYLSGVFHVAAEQWGFDLFKLDFLFAVCLAPPPGKTRGQVMHEAMAFLRRQVGERQILACGVPLGSAFGLADFCRIGGDVHLKWEHRLLAFLRHRERVSTLASLRSTLGRWQLNRRAFRNDPDVFILRREHQALTLEQQNTLLVINVLLGGILFCSDNVGTYSPEQRAELEDSLAWQGSQIQSVRLMGPDFYRIDFVHDQTSYTAWCNLSGQVAATPETKNGRIMIQPFETLILNV